MIRRVLAYVLACRLESVIAGAVSLCLIVLVTTTSLFKNFELGMHDVVFLLLPLTVLVFRLLLQSINSSQPQEAAKISSPLVLIKGFLLPFEQLFLDWLPFVLLSTTYFSLYSNFVLRINPHLADPLLARIDEKLFGVQPAFFLEAYIHPWVTDVLNIVYFSYILFFPCVALYFYLQTGGRQAFRRIMMGYLTLILMGVISYILVPAVGPQKFFADRFTTDLQGRALSKGLSYIMGIKVGHDCFPSIHFGLVFLIALYIRDYRRRAYPLALFYLFLMGCSTIYLRYHYVIDVIAAVPYVFAARWLTDFLLRVWPGESQPATPAPADNQVSAPQVPVSPP